MGKFKHSFSLSSATKTTRMYVNADNTVQLDFVSGSCLRVAVYQNKNTILPTFSINPEGNFLTNGRDRLSTEGFALCTPQISVSENTEQFTLPCGIEVFLNCENFLLEYRKNGEILFADRAPLAYNFGGEFGKETYHYITRKNGEHIFGLGDKGGLLDKAGRAFRIETCDCMGYNAAESDPL
ncbi:MAG: hypothetical protein ACI4K9_00320, partial [Candidatus Fimenecus sp.]